MATKIQLRRGPATSWAASDPILAEGEIGLELDTGKRKIGDGVQAWTALPYDLTQAVAETLFPDKAATETAIGMVTPGPDEEIVGGPDGPQKRPVVVEQFSVAGTNVDPSVVVNPHVNEIAPDVYTSVIGGGGHQSTGYNNVIGGDPATVGTTTPNATVPGTGAHVSTIAGGYDHVINKLAGTVSGGGHNVVTGSHGTVGGGSYNQAANDYATVSGGTDNQAAGNRATVSGGSGNRATGTRGTVSGGVDNQATANISTVGGGEDNVASGIRGTVAGGQDNIASNDGATIPGGQGNRASAHMATAIGHSAHAYTRGMVAQASGMFATAGDAQSGRLVLRRVTTDAAWTVADTTGAGTTSHQMQQASAAMYRMQVIAREAATNDTKGWTIQGVVSNPTGASVVQVGGAPTPTVVAASAGAAAWNVRIITGADSFFPQVQGEAGKTINWVVLVEFVEVVV